MSDFSDCSDDNEEGAPSRQRTTAAAKRSPARYDDGGPSPRKMVAVSADLESMARINRPSDFGLHIAQQAATANRKSFFGGVVLSELSPQRDMAAGVLSPPDFFISRIVHDGRCFVPRKGHCVAQLDGIMWIFGGADANSVATGDLVKFVPGPNSFHLVNAKGECPGSRRDATFAPVTLKSGESFLLLYGGCDEDNKLCLDTWKFTPERRIWELIDPMGIVPDPRSQHICAVSPSGTAYVFGGLGVDGNPLADGHCLIGNTWSPMKNTNVSVGCGTICGHAAVYSEVDGVEVILSFGGDKTGNGSGTNELWQFDVERSKWTLIDDAYGDPPCPRFKHAVSLFDRRMWVTGGQYGGWFSSYAIADLYAYDLPANCWFKCDVTAKGMGYHADFGAIALLPAHRALYIFGGADYYGKATAEVSRLAPVITTVSVVSMKQDMVKLAWWIDHAIADLEKNKKSTETLNGQFENLSAEVKKCELSSKSASVGVENVKEDCTKIQKQLETISSQVQGTQERVSKIEKILPKVDKLETKLISLESSLEELRKKLPDKADKHTMKLIASKVEKMDMAIAGIVDTESTGKNADVVQGFNDSDP